MKRIAGWLLRAVVLVTLAVCPVGALADDVTAQVLAWIQANKPAMQAAEQFAWHGPAPEIPVPPMIESPCKKCGSTQPTQAEKDVDAWIKQSEQPELDYMVSVLAIARQYEIYQSIPFNDMTQAAWRAFNHFGERPPIETYQKIVRRLVERTEKMADKYDKEPKQAYAGIRLLLAVEQVSEKARGANSQDVEAQNVLDYCKTWMQSVVNKIDEDILQGHKYNLCVGYLDLVVSLQKFGGEAPADWEEMTGKIDKLLHFKVQMNLHGNGQFDDGSHFDITWTGTSKLRVHVDTDKKCYTPEMENGGQMAVKVQNFSMTTIVKHSDGTTETVPVELTSSRSFNVRIQPPLLNLCDAEPMLQLPFDQVSFPKETIRAKGHESPTALFGSMLSAAIAPNNVNSKETNAVTGASPKVDQAPAPDASQQQMQAAQAQMNAHKNDPSWFMSPEGQAAIAKIQQAAMAQAQGKMAAKGVSTPNVTNMQELAASLGAAHLEWTNGSTTPASKSMHAAKDGGRFEVSFTVTQETAQ